MKNLKEFIPLLKLVKEKRKTLLFASLIIVLCSLSSILTGYLCGEGIEFATKLNIKMSIISFGIYAIIDLTLNNGTLNQFAYSKLQKVENYITRKLGYNTYIKALNLPAVAYEQHSSGEIINRIVHDADTLSFMFGRLLRTLSGIVAAFLLIFYILYKSWIIGLFIIFILALLALNLKIFNPKMKKAHKERKKYQDIFTSHTTESIRGIREIKTLGIKKRLIKEAYENAKKILGKSNKEIDIRVHFNLISNTLRTILEIGTFIICAILLYYKQISLGFFIAMTYYVYRYTWLIENINDFAVEYQRLIVALGRVNEILENKLYKDDKFGKTKLENIKGTIKFDNVTFAYPNEDNILNKFSVTFEPNKKIAVVGKSGQGKSTIYNLLTRIFDAKEGNIYIDDVNLLDLDEKSLRKNISIIRQEPFIFNRTILENFKLIDNNIKLKDVRKYCQMAYLDDYIMSLPKKYNTILGEGGVNLSGGQKQRLSIARTLAKESKIIMFDEATSALDNQSQEFIKKSIDNLVKDHTIIIVAHRLSTIIDADIIYVVDKGKIVATGTHQELLNNSKIYKNLYETESLNS